MNPYWSAVVAGLSPYVPGEQPQFTNLVKLNTNENPYPPSPRVSAAIRDELGNDASALRLYPEPTSERLRLALGRRHGVGSEQVFVGNGSDEVLAHVFLALLKHSRPLKFPDVTYSFYPVYCGLYGIDFQAVPVGDEFDIRIDDYVGGDPGAVIFPNPNAPTGHALRRVDIDRLATALPQVPIVIDEAYVEFGAETSVPLIGKHPNILVVQTLSKAHSLAGMRVGYALGQPQLIEALTRVKDSFNSYPLDRLAQVAAVAAVEDVAYLEQTRAKIMATREALISALRPLGFAVVPSAANFVFVRHRTRDAAAIAAALRARHIIVRHFRAPRTAGHLRITVGTDAQCAALISALSEFLG